ncbi:MAG: sigma-70 family RNA polymerase sigma factor [Candidatus Eisenbacteria bacterium]|uniref:Sigma-70 family RNA polymerase sigma factor n=1 Tax=Eiseniibacteriota bacterium TaxID=2212470 RepID=A0A956M298_UNCEI|nr:sigma-70 family RNA polymerase sigma factor [Candidatus Eisenbacteria bacterium]
MLPVETLFQDAKMPARDRRRVRSFLERMEDEATDALAQLIGKLPERQRIALALRFYEALRPEEIAVVLGTREDTVHELLRKATESVGEGMRRSAEKQAAKSARRR